MFGRISAYITALLPECVQLLVAIACHGPPLERLFALPVELLQVLLDVIKGVTALRRHDSLELELLRALLLHRHELNNVQICISQVVLTVNVFATTWSLFPTFL